MGFGSLCAVAVALLLLLLPESLLTNVELSHMHGFAKRSHRH